MKIGNYFIEDDGDGYIIYEKDIVKKGKTAGEEVIKNKRYYGNLRKAMVRLLDLNVSVEGVEDMNTIIERIDRAKQEIINKVNEVQND